MACFPQSGGCEHRRILPFIAHVNELEESDYQLESCLDIEQRNSPQPEAIYRDSTGRGMVVERKSVVWPLNYAELHNADHYLANVLAETLRPIVGDAPAMVEVRSGISVDRPSLVQFGEALAAEVQRHIEELKKGLELTFGPCRFRFQSDSERDEWEPSKGLGITFLPRHYNDLDDPSVLPARLIEYLRKMTLSAKRKFADYGDCRQVLLIECFGEIQWKLDHWWSIVLRSMATELGGIEVWLGLEDSFEDGSNGFFFWKVYPMQIA